MYKTRAHIGAQFRVPTCVQDPLASLESDLTITNTSHLCFFLLSASSKFVVNVSCWSQRKCSSILSSFSNFDNNCLSECELATTYKKQFRPI